MEPNETDKPEVRNLTMAEYIAENDLTEATNRAVYCFGTAKLLEKRRKRLRFWNRINKFIGLFIPVFIGLSFMSAKDLPIIISTIMLIFPYIAFILNASMFVISILALVAEWDAKIENYTDSISNNMQYFNIFKEILDRYYESPKEYSAKLKETTSLDNVQQKQDGRENFSLKEYRFITRVGLYQLHLPCPECNKVPSLEKTKNCENCGVK